MAMHGVSYMEYYSVSLLPKNKGYFAISKIFFREHVLEFRRLV